MARARERTRIAIEDIGAGITAAADQREQRRRRRNEQLEAARALAVESADAYGEPFYIDVDAATAGRTGAVLTQAYAAVEGAAGIVTLVSAEGTAFQVPRAAALMSGTVRSALDGRCRTEGSPPEEIVFAEIDSALMKEAVRYMIFKEGKARNSDAHFKIDDTAAIELFRAASYLDL